MNTNMHCLSYLAHFFLEWEIIKTKVVEEIKAHFVFNNFFLVKIMQFRRNVEKYCRAGQATYDNMTHAHCMLDTQVNKYTHAQV